MIIIKIIGILIVLRWMFQSPLQVITAVIAMVLLAKSGIDMKYLEQRKAVATTTREISDCDVAKYGLWRQYVIAATIAVIALGSSLMMPLSIKSFTLIVVGFYAVVTGIAQAIRAVKR